MNLSSSALAALSGLFFALLPPLAGAQTAQATESRTYTPGAFDSIEISGAANVRFNQGAMDQVRVDGSDEVQKTVALEVRDGVLFIRPAGAWKFWHAQRVQIEVQARELRRVSISGAADLLCSTPLTARQLTVNISGAGLARLDQVKADSLHFQVSGAGDGQLAGSVDDLRVQVSGRGNISAEQLLSQRATVSISGIGNVKVWAVQELGIAVSGVGTVDYWGTPRVRRSTSGIGKVNDQGAKAVPQ